MTQESLSAARKPIRWRAAVWGVLLSIPACYWNAWQPTGALYSMIFSTMGCLIALILVNRLLHSFAPRLVFATSDLVVIFGMVSVASAIGGEWAFLNMQYVHHFAAYQSQDPENFQFMLKVLPDSMYFKDPEQIKDFIAGGQGYGYFLTKLDLWLPKILMWTLLYGMITISLLCINSLMRDAWLRKERLSFPIIQLPVAMMEENGRGPLWKSKAMWIAFGIMFTIDMLNGFHYLYPNLPSIPTKNWFDLGDVFKEAPLNALRETQLSLYPFLAALGLFMPSDLLFSVIFFFITRKVILVAMATYGVDAGKYGGGFFTPSIPYFTEQTWGAIIGLFVSAIWLSRRHLKQVWMEIRSGVGSEDGGVPHRYVFLLLLLCIGGVSYVLYLGDLPPAVILPYFLAFLAFSFVLTRMRAQLGPPAHEFAFFGPNQLLMNFYGTDKISAKAGAWIGSIFLGINRLSRSHCMPPQLEAMKMADDAKLKQGPLFGLLALSLCLGMFLTCMWFVQKGYVRGADQGWGDPIAILNGIKPPNDSGTNWPGVGMVGTGFSVVMILDFLRFRFPGFILHPVGYALSMNFGVDYFWFGLVIALLVKTFVQRYYGLAGYKQLRNVAFGILIAEYSAETIWAVYSMITRNSSYTIGFNERGIGAQ